MRNEKRANINTPQVVGEVIDGEAVIINLESGFYYSLGGIGGEIWTGIEGGLSLNRIADEISSRYKVDKSVANEAVKKLVDELVGEGLVTLQSGDGAGRPPSDPTRADEPSAPFTPPVLVKYEDMQDLLLLDPIHEVDELGWPNVKPDDG